MPRCAEIDKQCAEIAALAAKKTMCWVVPPPSNSGNEGLGWDSLLKIGIILVMTVTARGDNPNDVFFVFEINSQVEVKPMKRIVCWNC